jgi:type VI secretion system protein ImpL
MHWGLYEGRSLANSARDAYVRELDSILLPRFATQIQSRLVKYSADPQKLYVYFKGYLMLNDTKHLDKPFLQRLADLEWKHAEGGAATAGPAAANHFTALLENATTLRPLPLDSKLVGQARSSLPRTLIPRILYDDIKAANVDEPGQGLRIDQLAGIGSEQIFRRKSGVPLSTPIPHLYTKDQFNLITVKNRVDIMDLLRKDAWIWGDNAASALASAGTLFSSVSDLYEADYIRTWDGFLDDLEVVHFPTVGQAKEALRILTSQASPLRGLLRAVEANTTLVETTTSGAPKTTIGQTTKRIGDAISGITKSMEEAVGRPSVEPGTNVTVHYQWVRQLLAGDVGKARLDNVINAIAEIQKQIEALGDDVAGKSSTVLISDPQFRVQVQTLRQQAEALPPVVGRLVTEIAENPVENVRGDVKGKIEEVYRDRIVTTCNTLIGNRYPFATTSAEVQLSDFGTVFGYDGLFDKFFADYLQNQVDTTAAVWSWREGSVNMSTRLLDQLQQARHIRDMFFIPGSKTPEVKFFVAFSDLDPDAQRAVLTIDGQIVDDQRARQPVTWPGSGAGAASAAFEARYFDQPRGYQGPWAWFRMVDAMRVGAPDAQQRIGLIVQDHYHRVRVTLEPARATGNPFASGSWRQFTCEL